MRRRHRVEVRVVPAADPAGGVGLTGDSLSGRHHANAVQDELFERAVTQPANEDGPNRPRSTTKAMRSARRSGGRRMKPEMAGTRRGAKKRCVV